MTGNCRDCKHFRSNDWPPYESWGDCRRLVDDAPTDPAWSYSQRNRLDKPPDGRLAIPWDHEGYSAGLHVSPEFGCVMFEERS